MYSAVLFNGFNLTYENDLANPDQYFLAQSITIIEIYGAKIQTL